MKIISKVITYLNPIAQLGKTKYSFVFPFLLTLLIWVFSEIFAYDIVKDPMVVGAYVIYLSALLIIYFAFRDGIRGGVVATLITIAYYVYIIYTRHYVKQQLSSGIEATVILALLYLFLVAIIGGLKQTIDVLIEREADEKKRLQTIVQQLSVGVVITDNKGVVQQTNKQLDAILGVKLSKGLDARKGRMPRRKQNNNPIDISKIPLAAVLATEKPVIDKEYVIEKPDGKKVYVNVNASVIHNKRGKVIAAASIINDITQQKEMEARKDDFVNMASHELKTPITSMKLYIESLINRIKQYDDEKADKMLSSVKYQTERLQGLVSDLLDVSRLQTGKLSFTKEKFDMHAFIQETIESLQAATKEQQIVYVGKKSVVVYADKFRMYQVLTNLLTNAIKYSPPGKNITVGIKKTNGKVFVSVKDSGMGIAKGLHKKIFERLYQVTDPTEKTFPGLGMGLYISKEIIKRHKGKIWVESKKGNGSTFYFSLPLKKAP